MNRGQLVIAYTLTFGLLAFMVAAGACAAFGYPAMEPRERLMAMAMALPMALPMAAWYAWLLFLGSRATFSKRG